MEPTTTVHETRTRSATSTRNHYRPAKQAFVQPRIAIKAAGQQRLNNLKRIIEQLNNRRKGHKLSERRQAAARAGGIVATDEASVYNQLMSELENDNE